MCEATFAQPACNTMGAMAGGVAAKGPNPLWRSATSLADAPGCLAVLLEAAECEAREEQSWRRGRSRGWAKRCAESWQAGGRRFYAWLRAPAGAPPPCETGGAGAADALAGDLAFHVWVPPTSQGARAVRALLSTGAQPWRAVLRPAHVSHRAPECVAFGAKGKAVRKPGAAPRAAAAQSGP